MKAIFNNVDKLKYEIGKLIDEYCKNPDFGDVTGGDIMDALLQLRDKFIIDLTKGEYEEKETNK